MAQPNALLILERLPYNGEPWQCGGHSGCGQCSDCKRNARRATAKVLDCDRPYLGPRTFSSLFPAPATTTPEWLVNHWPKTRLERRRAILAEVLNRSA